MLSCGRRALVLGRLLLVRRLLLRWLLPLRWLLLLREQQRDGERGDHGVAFS